MSGALAKLMQLLRREAPAQAETAREALRRAAATGNEQAVVGVAENAPLPSRIVAGRPESVVPSARDRARALAERRSVIDLHTHPAADTSATLFAVAPSKTDLAYYAANYPELFPRGTELRTLIATPPSASGRTGTGFHMFATDDPATMLSPSAADAARYELQRAGARGRFASIVDDPLFKDYFDYGNDLGDVLDEASTMALLGLRAQQGRGRQELLLPRGRTVTPDPQTTPAEFYRRLAPSMIELLRERKFARGGIAQVKERARHG